MVTKLYVEGGGNSKALRTACRRGFRQFLEKAGLEGKMPRIIACGGRQNAFDSFTTAVATREGTRPALLVDAEAPYAGNDPWAHLGKRDQWKRPDDAGADDCFLMVQIMESWFLADCDALAAFFGQGFNPSALPSNPKLEQIAKQDVLRGLEEATHHAKTKRRYDKGSHSFDVLGTLNPERVAERSPEAKRLLQTLRSGQ